MAKNIKSEIRKILRTAYLRLTVDRTCGRYLKACLRIVIPPVEPGDSPDYFMDISAQSDDLRVADPYSSFRNSSDRKAYDRDRWMRSNQAHRLSDLYLTDAHPFYAVRMEDLQVEFFGQARDKWNPVRATAIRDLVLDMIERKNLRFVYPECELSRVVAALRELGCTLDYSNWKIENMERGDWLRSRGNSEIPPEDPQAVESGPNP